MRVREPGWAGLAFSTAQFAQTATASYFGKDLNIYDGPLRLRSLYTLHCPTSVAYLPVEVGLGANILAMTEGHQVRRVLDFELFMRFLTLAVRFVFQLPVSRRAWAPTYI